MKKMAERTERGRGEGGMKCMGSEKRTIST